MEPRSSERIAKRKSRVDEMEIEETADVLTTLKNIPVETSSNFSIGRVKVDPMDSLTPLLKSIYGSEIIEKWRMSGKDLRSIWELSPPQVQCSHIIDSPKSCWICGGGFVLDKDALKPICDHVLPIAQAVFFLQLYAAQKKRAPTVDDDSKKIFKLEYDWAHSLCNTIKSSAVLIKSSKQGLSVNVTEVRKLLVKIRDTESNQPGYQSIIGMLSNPDLIAQRSNSMASRIQQIVDFVNEPISRGEGNLQLLAQSSSYVDPTLMRPAFSELLSKKGGRKTFKHKGNGIRRSKKRSTRKSTRVY
jgi:hypothetical protein